MVFFGKTVGIELFALPSATCAAKDPTQVLLDRVNKDKNCCIFFFSRSASTVCKSLSGNIV